MELYLQFGHGMMSHSKELIKKWNGGTVILSPRDLTREQILTFSKDVRKIGGQILLDPQFYDPRANHHRLINHDFWPSTYDTKIFMEDGAVELLLALKELNTLSSTESYIVPGIIFEESKPEWFLAQDLLVKRAVDVFDDKGSLATIALSANIVRNETTLEQILALTESWPVDGYYVVAEHPTGQYLVEDPIWLSNLLIFLAGLKLQGKKVVLGYANHQLLISAIANVDAIASGIWLNVRSFSTKKFQQIEDDATSRRARWYYCPQTFSEYKIPFLDIGFRSGVSDLLRPINGYFNEFSSLLFSGALPSLVNYTETMSFRHYLFSLWMQAQGGKRESFKASLDSYTLILNSAEDTILKLQKYGVRGQDRDFGRIIDVNRAAVAQLEASRGFALSMNWN